MIQNGRKVTYDKYKKKIIRVSIKILSWFVLVGVSIAVVTHCDLGRKGFVLLTLPHPCSSLKEVRAEAQTGQGPGGGNWLFPHSFLSWLSCFCLFIVLLFVFRDRDSSSCLRTLSVVRLILNSQSYTCLPPKHWY